MDAFTVVSLLLGCCLFAILLFPFYGVARANGRTHFTDDNIMFWVWEIGIVLIVVPGVAGILAPSEPVFQLIAVGSLIYRVLYWVMCSAALFFDKQRRPHLYQS